MKKMVIASFVIATILICIISCSKSSSIPENPTACDGVAKKFANDVNPIIQTFCNQAACHNTGSTNGPGPLTNYNEIFSARVHIREQVQAGLMPQNTSLTIAQKNTIICWIDNGAPND